MLFVPLATGAAAGAARGGGLASSLVLAAAAFFLFCLHAPVESLLGTQPLKATRSERRFVLRYAVGFGAAAALCLGWLMLRAHAAGLLLIGCVAALGFAGQAMLRKWRRDARMLSQIAGAFGLACTAPAAYHVTTGSLDATALGLWLMNALFAAGQIHYVQLRVTGAKLAGFASKFEHGRRYLAFLLAVLTLVAAAAASRWIPAAVPFAFVPAAARSLCWFVAPAGPLRLKHLGFAELGHAIVFGALLSFAYLTV